MQLVYGNDDAVATWTARKLKLPIHPPYIAIGVIDDDGNPIGGMVFNDWTGSNIEITIYGPRALTRKTLRAAFRYVFLEAKAIRLTARTKRNNAAMKKLLRRLGFKLEGVLRNYYGPTKSGDAFLFRLDPQVAAKWM